MAETGGVQCRVAVASGDVQRETLRSDIMRGHSALNAFCLRSCNYVWQINGTEGAGGQKEPGSDFYSKQSSWVEHFYKRRAAVEVILGKPEFTVTIIIWDLVFGFHSQICQQSHASTFNCTNSLSLLRDGWYIHIFISRYFINPHLCHWKCNVMSFATNAKLL